MDIFSVFTLCGGLAFFLYGMTVMSKSLEKMAGGKLERMLKRMTSSPFKSLLLGAGITIAIQSSSAMTVMLVGLVNSGVMELRQTIGIIMGSNIGTTLTAWILSLTGIESENVFVNLLKPENFSPLIALAGILLIMGSKRQRRRDVGRIMMGFAILMYGMELMSGAVSPLAEMPQFAGLLTAFENPLLGVLVGAVFTGIIQSSAASVAILQALAMTGSITYGMAIPIIMGQNIGTCITAMLSSVGASRNARRAALIHLLFNLTGAGVWLAVFWLVKVLAAPTMLARPVTLPGVAVIHTAFNLLCTMLLFPAAGLLERAVLRLLPGEDGEKGTELDPRLLAAPAAALEKCRELAGDMAALARDNLRRGVAALTEVQPASAKELRRQEERIDRMEDVLGTFLVRLSGQTLTRRDNARAAELLALIGDFERLGDHAMNLLESGEELRDKDISLPTEDRRELRVLTDAVEEIADLALDAFRREDPAVQAEVEALEQVIDGLKEQLRSRRIRRMQQGSGTMELGFVWSDVLTDLERAADHCSNIAGCVAGLPDGNQGLHAAQTALRQQDPAFEDRVRRYAEKYRV